MNFYFNSKNFIFKTIVIFLLFLSCLSNTSAQKPNVIFILSDDIGYDILSVNGNKTYSTPNIDSMAHHGINFTHCEATPLCSPSRYMLLTGKYNLRNYSNWGYMSDSEKTFGNLMQDAGYETGFFGKLQLPFSANNMAKWGFDKYDVFGLTENDDSLDRYKNPSLFDNNGRLPQSAILNKYCDDILVDNIKDFIDSNYNNPFFVYYSMSIGHQPFSPTPDDSAFANWNPYKDKSDTSFYPSMIHYMDLEVGKILNKLKETGLDKNTIIIFSGDNGTPDDIFYDAAGSGYVEGEKGLTTEKGTHVPLIAYWSSKIKEGQVNDDLIDFSDFFPTFAEAANVTDLSKYGSTDGVSFYKRMLGEKSALKQQLFFDYWPHPGFGRLKRWVMNKNYKLYDSLDGSPGSFYNIVTDLEEKKPLKNTSLTNTEKHIKARFQRILDSLPNWPQAPKIDSPYVTNITANSATLGATIINSGATNLIDRGSTYARVGQPYLNAGRMRDSLISLGKFTENRVFARSETLYNYSLYAMNANNSHSTSFALSSFYTLSAPPLLQPSYFKACTDSSSILLNWGKAKFPSNGASQGGYAIFYSTDIVKLIDNANGLNPSKISKNGTLIFLPFKPIREISDTSFRISGLQKNSKYYFLLIPYTCNGITDSTYNYLTAGALSVTANYTAPLTLNLLAKNPVCFNGADGSVRASAFNGIAPYSFSINNGDYTSDSIIKNLSAGNYLLTVKDAGGCVNSENIDLISPEKIKLSLAIKNSDCMPDGQIIASAKNGIPPYMFSFNSGNFDTTSEFDNLSKGNYLIAVKDGDQCISSSNAVVTLTTQNCAEKMNVMPNPSSSVFTLTVGSNQISDHIQIKVYNTIGKLVYSNQGTQKLSYTFGNAFMKGVYFVEVNLDSTNYKFKIIKE